MNRGKGSIARMRIGGQHGYTIVEVLIFLAVSAVLFGSTMALLSGRQQRAHFTNTVRDFETRLLDIANDVSNGYYQSAGNITCNNALQINVNAPGNTNTQGTNDDCIMLGRVIKFGYDNANGGSERYGVYTLVGRRQVNEKDVSDLSQSGIKLLWVNGNNVANQSLHERKNIGYGVTIKCVAVGTSPCGVLNNGAIAFMTKLGGGVQPGVSGSALFANTYVYGQLPVNSTESTFPNSIDTSQPQLLTQPLTICLLSGGSNQYALIKLTNGRVTSEIKAGTSCN